MVGWMTSFVINIIELLNRLLTAPPIYDEFGRQRFSFNNDGNHNNNNDKQNKYSDEQHQKEEDLQAAYDMFETNDKDATREYLKKKYKRLSLLHHPDRNGNSPESVEMMQKLNHYYDLMDEVLDRKDGAIKFDHESSNGNNSDSEHGKEDSQKEEMKNDEDEFDLFSRYPTEESLPKGPQARKFRRRWHQYNRRRQREREEMEKEMEKERKQQQEKMKEQIAKQKNERKKQTRKNKKVWEKNHLNSTHGRSTANNEWVNSRAADSATTKPINMIMEYNYHDLAVALQLGHDETVINTINSHLDEIVHRILFLGANIKTVGLSDVEISIRREQKLFFLISLDEDGNTILHYAVYHGRTEVINYITYLGRRLEFMPDLYLRNNVHGYLPKDYANHSGNPNVVQLLNSYTQEAQHGYEEIHPTMKNVKEKIYFTFRSLHIAAIFSTFGAFFVGTNLIGSGKMISLIATIFSQSQHGDIYDPQEANYVFAYFFAIHLTWHILNELWKSPVFVPLMLLLVPVSLLIGLASYVGRDLLDVLLLPFTAFLFVVQVFSNCLGFVGSFIPIPKFIQKTPFERTYYLLMYCCIFYGISLVISTYFN